MTAQTVVDHEPVQTATGRTVCHDVVFYFELPEGSRPPRHLVADEEIELARAINRGRSIVGAEAVGQDDDLPAVQRLVLTSRRSSTRSPTWCRLPRLPA